MALLEVAGLTVRFGGVTAVRDVSLAAEAGAVTGLVGPKGSGRTTVLDVVLGLRRAATGVVRLDGRDINHLTPNRRARAGLACTSQRLDVFGSLTVRDNVLVAREIREGLRSIFRGGRVARAKADELVEWVGIGEHAGVRADSVPAGVARLVQLARALVTQPRLLLLDEPSAGMDDALVTHLGVLLRRLADRGCAVLLVEHEPELAMDVCDRLHVMEFGTVVAAGTPAEIGEDQRVRELTR